MITQSFDVHLDVTEYRCPMPLLKTKQALSSMKPGDILKVSCTDSGSWRDIPSFIDLSPHDLLDRHKSNDEFIFFIKKGE